MRVTHVITRLIVGGAQQNTIASVLGLRAKPGFEVNLISGPTVGPEGTLEPQVAAVPNSTTFTVEIPLYWNYRSSLAPQVTKQNGMVVNAGLEDLTIDNSVVQDAHAGLVWYAANSWFLRVEIHYAAREGLSLIGYRNTIRSCSIHGTSLPLGPNSGYGLWGQNYASANVIEDNVMYDVSNPIILNGEFSGNVIAYNYLHAHDGNVGRQNGAFSSHGAHPIMNLLEGNDMVGEVALDFTWGSSSHYTFFRNRAQLQTPISTYGQYKFLMDFNEKNWYQNVVGNVLWTPSLAGTYECSGALNINSSACLYSLGYSSDGTWTQKDGSVASTMYRHGNYDDINNSTVWDPAVANHAIPPSLYLSAKPSWWGSGPWPPIGPDVVGLADKIPAQIRFEGGMTPPWGDAVRESSN